MRLHIIYTETYCKLHIVCNKGKHKECPTGWFCPYLINKSNLRTEEYSYGK